LSCRNLEPKRSKALLLRLQLLLLLLLLLLLCVAIASLFQNGCATAAAESVTGDGLL